MVKERRCGCRPSKGFLHRGGELNRSVSVVLHVLGLGLGLGRPSHEDAGVATDLGDRAGEGLNVVELGLGQHVVRVLPGERLELAGEDFLDTEELHLVIGVARCCEDRVGGGVNRQPFDLHVLRSRNQLGRIVEMTVKAVVGTEKMDDLAVIMGDQVGHRERADIFGQLNFGSQAPVELLELTGLEAEVLQHVGDAVRVDGRDHGLAGGLRRSDLDVEVAVLSSAESENLRLLGHADRVGVDRQLVLLGVADEPVVWKFRLLLLDEGAADGLQHGLRDLGAAGQDEGLLIDEDDLLDVGDLVLAGDLDLLWVHVVFGGVDDNLVQVVRRRVPDAEDCEVAKLHVAILVLGAEEFVSTGLGHLGRRVLGVHEFLSFWCIAPM